MRVPRVATVVCLMALFAGSAHGQSRVNELNDAGWKALRDGYANRAAGLFGDALALRPDDPVLLMGAAAAAHAQGKQKDAIAGLQQALKVKPDLTPASVLLGQIAFDEGDVDLAIRTYESALKYAPGDAQIARTLEQWRKDAGVHETFDELRYDRFRILFEGHDERSLALEATRMLNSAFFRIAGGLGEYPPDTIVIILYTEQQFRDLTRAPKWSAGAYDRRIRIPVGGASQQPELFEKVLTHELTHAIIAGIAPASVPAWLNEGLAQYFDGTDATASKRRMKALGRSIPLKQLEEGFGGFGAAAAQVAYDEALLAVNVIAERPGFVWTRLLDELEAGESVDDALRSFGFSYEDFETRFAR
jgi:tetratricopeptide (TPR) repeat protein